MRNSKDCFNWRQTQYLDFDFFNNLLSGSMYYISALTSDFAYMEGCRRLRVNELYSLIFYVFCKPNFMNWVLSVILNINLKKEYIHLHFLIF